MEACRPHDLVCQWLAMMDCLQHTCIIISIRFLGSDGIIMGDIVTYVVARWQHLVKSCT